MILLPPSSLTVSVDGDGALRFVRNGALVYARRATLHAANGILVNEAGLSLAPRIAVGGAFSVSLDGTIVSGGKVAGRLVLAQISGGRATLMNPGEGLAGVIRSGGASVAAPVASPAASPKIRPLATRPLPIATAPSRVAATNSGLSKAAPISIVVRVESQLDGDRLLLGGIAEIEAPAGWRDRLASLDLGLLPPIGATRLIGLATVRSAVRSLGLTPEKFTISVPNGAIAMRNGAVVESQAIIDEALEGHAGYVSARPIPPLAVPSGKLELTANAPQPGMSGMTVEVKAVVNGKPVGTRIVSLIPDPSIPAAKIGETIRLRLISGGAAIEIPAKVKTPGRQGSEITVVTETGSIHTGRLLPNGLVEVRL